jgi:hypothetical protein
MKEAVVYFRAAPGYLSLELDPVGFPRLEPGEGEAGELAAQLPLPVALHTHQHQATQTCSNRTPHIITSVN